jgi:hypothetical protein
MLYFPLGMPTVFIIAQDWLLRAGVRAQLCEEGIAALGMETMDQAAQAIARGTVPSAVVMEDTASETASGPEGLARSVPVIVVASRTLRASSLPSAAAVLYRPVRVADVVACVQKVLRGQPV